TAIHIGSQIGRFDLGSLGPTPHRYFAVARVDRYTDPLRAVACDEFVDQVGLVYGGRAEDHAVDDLQPALGCGNTAYPATQLDPYIDSGSDALDGLAVGAALERRIEVYQVEQIGPQRRPMLSGRQRVLEVDGLLRRVALVETH